VDSLTGSDDGLTLFTSLAQVPAVA
jgi:hypothetical protein